MRKRIQQLARGEIDCIGPELKLSVSKIEQEVLEGRELNGEFELTSMNQVKLRGIIYSTNPRMECLTPQFEGEEVHIRYQFHSEGLIEGDIQKGDFVIVCNQGEYNLSFAVSISKLYADSELGKIRNLTDFTRLSRESFEKAYRLFYSQNFRNILKKEEKQEKALYELVRKKAPSKQNMEAFLVACKQKKLVQVELEQSGAVYQNITEVQKQQVMLKKSQWGYVEAEVETDADFLILEKKALSLDDFVGNSCQFHYYIEPKFFHGGRNFGKILFHFAGDTLEYTVTASGEETIARDTDYLERHKCQTQLAQLYIDYRLKKIVTGVWAKSSIELLERLIALKQDEDFYQLMKAQAYLLNRQRQEASWILEAFKRDYPYRDTPVFAYYLYLCTLLEREPSYVDRLTAEIEEIFKKHKNSSLVFWILLFEREDYYVSNAKRLKAIEEWVAGGNDSPYLYLEAYYLFWQDPYLLIRLGNFERKILNWAVKQQAISKDLAEQILSLCPSLKTFDRVMFRVLEACYEVLNTDEVLSAICSYLVKGQEFSTVYHKWFALGIEHELRITNLYEAYLLSMDPCEIVPVPKMIQLYFQYENKLPYQQTACLYVNILAEKERKSDVFLKYQRMIEQFAMQQIERGKIDDNLAVIYREMLPLGILNEELAERFAPLLFAHKLIVKRKNIRSIIVKQPPFKEEQELSVTDGVAYFSAYTSDYTVMLEDKNGNCFADASDFEDEALMNPEIYLSQCLELAPDNLYYLLAYFYRKERQESFEEWELEGLSDILRSDMISEDYKISLVARAITAAKTGLLNTSLEKLMEFIDIGKIPYEHRAVFVSYMTESHLYDKAYQMVVLYGYDYLGQAAKVLLCSYKITQNSFEEDDFLLEFAKAAFDGGKYDGVILSYLCNFYQGPTKEMAEIWKFAKKFEIDTYDLEERIITQMLYSTDYIDCIGKIYESYCNAGGKDDICMAFLSYFSYYFVTHDMVVPEQIFDQIEQKLNKEAELNDACKIGLLKHYADKKMVSDLQEKLIDKLLTEFLGKNIYFAFYKNFNKKMNAKNFLRDKYFLEYHSQKGIHVTVNYSIDHGEYTEAELAEVYDGIYVKDFILFFGESLQYYITEETEGKRVVTESNQIINHDLYGEQEQDVFAKLNEMSFQLTLQDKNALKRSMSEYVNRKEMAKQLFKLC